MAVEVGKIAGIAEASIAKVFGIAVASIGKVGGIAYPAAGGFPLAGWTYRKSITLSRASGAVSNYQMKLLVGESSGATGEDVDCGGHVAADFDDLRFTTSDGETLLDYWIESISGSTPNGLATVWIEFDTIGTSATTFYMYYGGTETAVSSGDDTFLFFDDFNDASVDAAKWDNTGSYSEGSGVLSKYAANTSLGYEIVSKNAFATPLAICARAKISSAITTWHFVVAQLSTWNTNGHLGGFYPNAWYLQAKPAGTSNNVAGAVTNDTWYQLELRIITANQKLFVDGVEKPALTTNPIPVDPQKILLYTARANSGSDATTSFDWVRVRQYLATEPAWGAWGAEES